MTFNKEFMQSALIRINELQNEMVEKSKMVDGSDEYVKQKMKLFEQSEKVSETLKDIQIAEQTLTDNFLSACK